MRLSDEVDQRRDRLLKIWANDLEMKGFTDIKVDLEGYPDRPEMIGGSLPDITARRSDGKTIVGEIWMCEHIDQDEGMFQRAMDYSFRESIVMLLVPFDCMEEAQSMLDEWGLDQEIFLQGTLD